MNAQGISIGRSPECDVVVDERWDTVSNEHAHIKSRDGVLVYADHSSNGTVINRQKIHNREVEIYPGDVILLAGVYELGWNVINGYFPQSKRPTVIHNIRGEREDTDSRRTVRVNAAGDPGGASSRPTERRDEWRRPTVDPKSDRRLDSYNDNYGRENAYSQAGMDAYLGKWNWGAFLATWIWGVGNGIYWPLCVIPLAFIPYLGQVAALAISVYLGLRGSRLAWEKGSHGDFQSFVRSQKRWIVIGVVILLLGIAVTAFNLYFIMQLA